MSKIIGNNLELEGVSKINGLPTDQLGGGEGANYLTVGSIANSSADITAWTGYVNPSAVAPTSGQGGSPGITWTRNTTNPLSGLGDFLLTKDAVNRQGEGVSIPFTIENRHLAKVMKIECDAELRSGIFNNHLFNAQATYSVTSNVCTVTLQNTFTTGTKVTILFETGGATALSNTFTLTGATATTFTFALTTANTSGNCRVFFVGSVRLVVVGDPTGTPFIEEPVGTQLQLGIVGQKVKFYATFQTHVSIRNYRLCIHVSGSTTNAFSIGFNNFIVWEQNKNIGAIITDWQPYTPTFQGFGTVTDLSIRWRRVGSSCEIMGVLKPGTTTGVEARIGLPNGLVASLGTTSTGEPQILGYAHRDASAPFTAFNLNTKNGFNYLNFGTWRSDVSANPFEKMNGNAVVNGGEDLSIYASVPIQGWGSPMALSSQAGDGRPVVGAYRGHTGTSLTANVTNIRFNTLIKDSHNAYNTSTGETTIPIDGDYVFTMTEIVSTSAEAAIRYWVDGVLRDDVFFGVLNNGNPNGFTVVIPNLRSGQRVTFKALVNLTTVTRPTGFSFFRIPDGNQVLARDEFVGASYYSSANQTSLTTQINFGVRVYDTHGAVTTGASWRFTAPVSGKYLVVNKFTGTSAIAINLFKNNSVFTNMGYVATGMSGFLSSSATIDLLAGEFIDIRPSASATAEGHVSYSSQNLCRIEISRIG